MQPAVAASVMQPAVAASVMQPAVAPPVHGPLVPIVDLVSDQVATLIDRRFEMWEEPEAPVSPFRDHEAFLTL